MCELEPPKSAAAAADAAAGGAGDDGAGSGGDGDGGASGPTPAQRIQRLIGQIANAHIISTEDLKRQLSAEALHSADSFKVKYRARDAALKVLLFALLGAAVLMPSEQRPCDLEAPLPAYSNASQPQCGWTAVDTFYFSICTLTIVGQPFFEPTWWLTQAFIIPYFFAGTLYIWPILRKLCGELPRLIRKVWYRVTFHLSGGQMYKRLTRAFHERGAPAGEPTARARARVYVCARACARAARVRPLSDDDLTSSTPAVCCVRHSDQAAAPALLQAAGHGL